MIARRQFSLRTLFAVVTAMEDQLSVWESSDDQPAPLAGPFEPIEPPTSSAPAPKLPKE